MLTRRQKGTARRPPHGRTGRGRGCRRRHPRAPVGGHADRLPRRVHANHGANGCSICALIDCPDPLGELRRLIGVHRGYQHIEAAEANEISGDFEGALVEFERARALLAGNDEAAFWSAILKGRCRPRGGGEGVYRRHLEPRARMERTAAPPPGRRPAAQRRGHSHGTDRVREECKPADKPGSVLAGAAGKGRSSIWDAGYPAPRAAHLRHGERAAPERRSARSLFGLAPGGVCLAGRSPGRRWALTPPFHRCPGQVRGCVISVALSFGSPRLGVTQRPALRSPDFPRTHVSATVWPACPSSLSSGAADQRIRIEEIAPLMNRRLVLHAGGDGTSARPAVIEHLRGARHAVMIPYAQADHDFATLRFQEWLAPHGVEITGVHSRGRSCARQSAKPKPSL